MQYRFIFLLLLLSSFCQPQPLQADIRLPNIFSSNMVLQRNQSIKIWGWADKREKVELLLGPVTYETRADREGKWEIIINPMPAGGPHEIIILGKNDIFLNNILFGDVWICAGQSNMQWTLDQTGYQESDLNFLNSARVRLFQVPIEMDYLPREEVAGGDWKSISADNIKHFSAVAYHYGKYIHHETGVPIGLISSNLGATAIEAWMSNKTLMRFDQFVPEIAPHFNRGKNFEQMRTDFEQSRTSWESQYYHKGPGIAGKWYEPTTDLSQWKEALVPGYWEETELGPHDGAVWFRREFDLPPEFSEKKFLISLNQIDDYDIAWVNGHKIGETFGRHNFRNYTVDSSLLKATGNVLVVRAFDLGGFGGFSTHAFWGNPIILGKWHYRVGAKIDPITFPEVDMPNASPFSSPGVLYNANIAPLTRFPIKGVIWYQGESNAGRASEYRDLFPALIQDWRAKWGQGNFPFLFVQLANYGVEPLEPVESTWAELREAQTAALELSNTGMAVTIDIGEAGDIHPRNKAEVGRRLGAAALKVAYQQKNIHSGPLYRTHTLQDSTVIIDFEHTGKGLQTPDKYGYVKGFQIAGAGKVFHWARAHIKGNQVIVSSDAVPNPVAVRYGWADNPGKIDLYNSAGLPASPFRTDTWDGITAGKKFDHTVARF